MDTAGALLGAIHDSPGDDLPRLAYADWLQEQEDECLRARGEFIHTQCTLARMHPGDPDRLALELRERELLHAHGVKWAFEGGTEFRRGFPVLGCPEGEPFRLEELEPAFPVGGLRVEPPRPAPAGPFRSAW